MTDRCCDLHVHSNFSDGSESPENLIHEAEKSNISALTLADHNTVSGVPDFLRAGKNSTVTAVAGIEFTTGYEGNEVHIVGMFLPEKYLSQIEDFTETRRRQKEESNRILVERLIKAGYKIHSYDDIKKEFPDSAINRVHISRELMACGYIGSVNEGFATLLSDNGKFYEPTPMLPSMKVIAAINDWGAVSVLAHPALSLSRDKIIKFVFEGNKFGLDGIEVKYSTYDEETEKFINNVSEEYGLLKSGGSDYHGVNKPDIHMGIGRGKMFIPYSYYEALRDRAESKGK